MTETVLAIPAIQLLNGLQPEARKRAIAWSNACVPFINANFPGLTFRITNTRRTSAEQVALNTGGLSDLTLGWHNFGLAWDFAIIDASGHYITDGSHPAYAALGNISLQFGCHYPIIMKSGRPDSDHIEFHPGVTLSEIIHVSNIIDELRT